MSLTALLLSTLLVLMLTGRAAGQTPDVPAPDPPEISALKELHLTTPLVEDGQPLVAIVTPASGEHDAAADRVQEAIESITGVTVPVVSPEASQAAIPLKSHLIALGNRSTNRIISELYDRYYTLLDRKYPGPGGYVVRTLHDPFGNGRNVIFAGGSDASGVEDAADVLVRRLRQAGGRTGQLATDRLEVIRLSSSYQVPEDIGMVPHWGQARGLSLRANFGQDSTRQHFRGNFGWNTISKHMALYYMTGNERHAREVVRLSFPDEEAQEELFAIDNRAYGDIEDPLASLHHYYAHLSILYWDLIEESPAFSDDERLRITRALNRQIAVRGRDHDAYQLTEPARAVSGRHSQYAALSLFALARYFHKHYPDPVWTQAWQGSNYYFQALHKTAWLEGQSENMYWYSTAIAPSVKYLVLTGDRAPLRNGNLPQLLRAHEQLISGREPGFALWFSALNHMNRIFHLTGDRRWLHYRERLGLDTETFRLGQSFWPRAAQTPQPPTDLVNRWSIYPLPREPWEMRDPGFPLAEAFLWGSFRSTPTGEGDFILLDGYDAEARNAMHKFALVELRIDGETILQGKSRGRRATIQGHLNQVMTKAAGMVEPTFPKSAALRHRGVIGQTATATGAVPDMTYASWQRTLAQRIGRYALVVDELVFEETKDEMEVQTLWQGAAVDWDEDRQVLHLTEESDDGDTMSSGQVRTADVTSVDATLDVARMSWVGAVEPGDRRTAFSLITPRFNEAAACMRLAHNAAMLQVPESALAVSGAYQNVQGELVVVAEDHLFGRALRRAEVGTPLVSADQPVDLDWDFETGRLTIEAETPTVVRYHAADAPDATARWHEVRLREEPLTLESTYPGQEAMQSLHRTLTQRADQAERIRSDALQEADESDRLPGAALRASWSAYIDGDPVELTLTGDDVRESQEAAYNLLNDRAVIQTAGRVDGSLRLFAARGRVITQLTASGEPAGRMETDAPIQALHWWSAADEEAGQPLLLAGTRDGSVVAFTPQGQRAWTFSSEMAPELVRTGQTQWFSQVLPGIFGLGSGRFIDGRPQAFVGSATTLEILNPDGTLAARRPAFWGPPTVFQVIDGPGNDRRLLAAREPSGRMRLAIFHSTDLERTSGFDAVPAGHNFVNPWGQMSRRHIFYEDMDGDGTREVVSDINGTWNRASIWKADGTPLHNANFGPGNPLPYLNVRDFTVSNLDGDDTKEVIAGTDDGWLMALDHRLEKVWARRLDEAPAVFATAPGREAKGRLLVVGCEDGTVLVLDRNGQVLRRGRVDGKPAQMTVMDEGTDPIVVVTTAQGRATGFALPTR